MMNDDERIRSLGVPGLCGSIADAREMARAHALWIILGVIAAIGLNMATPATLEGLLAAPVVATVTLGGFVWMCRWQQGKAKGSPPVSSLLLLGVGLSSLQLPLIGFAYMTQMLGGMIMVSALVLVQRHASPLFSIWFSVLTQALPFVPYLLLFCFAPVLVVAQRMSAARAIAASLKLWWRNPIAFLAFLMLALLVASCWTLPLWVVIPVPWVAQPARALGLVASGFSLVAPLLAFYRHAVAEGTTA